MNMPIDYDAFVQQQAITAFSGEQQAYVATVASRLPNNWQNDPNFIRQSNAWHNDPNFKKTLADAEKYLINFDCVKHFVELGDNIYTPSIDDHFKTVLQQAENEYPGALNLMPIVKLAMMEYNDHILTENIKAKKIIQDVVLFQYDENTKSCYLDGNKAIDAFNYYNSMKKSPYLPNIPQPAVLGIAIHNAHGYTGNGNISDMSMDETPAAISLMQRNTPDDCGMMPMVIDIVNNRHIYGLKDNKGLNTVFVQHDI